ncbi:MAG: Bug family tripartite tricarboxylate transporter substrate binding protein [Geminicoccaceae bacterium]
MKMRSILMVAMAATIWSMPTKAEWPERTVSMIIMSKEGGGMDRASRLLGEHLEKRLGQPIKYVNRPGASGRTALEAFRAAEADGHTIFSGNVSTLTMMAGLTDLDFAFADEFAWVGAYLVDPATIVTSSKSEIATLDELIAKARQEPITVGVANFKSVQTLALAQLRDAAEMQIEIIPYSGFKGASVDVMGGHIDAAVGNFSATEKLGDEVRYLGLFADQAPDARPGLDPIKSMLGADVSDAASIRGLGLHPALNEAFPDRFATLETAFMETIADPAFVESFSTIGADANQAVVWNAEDVAAAVDSIETKLESYREFFDQGS